MIEDGEDIKSEICNLRVSKYIFDIFFGGMTLTSLGFTTDGIVTVINNAPTISEKVISTIAIAFFGGLGTVFSISGVLGMHRYYTDKINEKEPIASIKKIRR